MAWVPALIIGGFSFASGLLDTSDETALEVAQKNDETALEVAKINAGSSLKKYAYPGQKTLGAALTPYLFENLGVGLSDKEKTLYRSEGKTNILQKVKGIGSQATKAYANQGLKGGAVADALNKINMSTLPQFTNLENQIMKADLNRKQNSIANILNYLNLAAGEGYPVDTRDLWTKDQQEAVSYLDKARKDFSGTDEEFKKTLEYETAKGNVTQNNTISLEDAAKNRILEDYVKRFQDSGMSKEDFEALAQREGEGKPKNETLVSDTISKLIGEETNRIRNEDKSSYLPFENIYISSFTFDSGYTPSEIEESHNNFISDPRNPDFRTDDYPYKGARLDPNIDQTRLQEEAEKYIEENDIEFSDLEYVIPRIFDYMAYKQLQSP